MRAPAWLMASVLLLAGPASAQTPAPIPVSVSATPRLDPAAPPASTVAAARSDRHAAAQAGGDALAAKVTRQLRGSFDAADMTHRGALTRAEAQAGGFGYVARHFDAIDTRRAGEVTFADVQRYLQSRGSREVSK